MSDDTPIKRYDDAEEKPFEIAHGDEENIEEISNHIENHIGPIDLVYHEIISSIVHIDVHWVKPTEKYPFHTFVTSGMSNKLMQDRDNAEIKEYAELFVMVPKHLIHGEAKESFSDIFINPDDIWIIHWLKFLAKFPHEVDTLISHGHTIPNGEEAAPFGENTKLGCMMLLPSITLPDEFSTLKTEKGKEINFYNLYPIYKEEMEYKLKNGTSKLLDKFDKHRISDIIDFNRINTCSKSKWKFW